MRFENKSVIITGGSGKIAKAYAIAFAKEGAKVSLPDVHFPKRSLPHAHSQLLNVDGGFHFV